MLVWEVGGGPRGQYLWAHFAPESCLGADRFLHTYAWVSLAAKRSVLNVSHMKEEMQSMCSETLRRTDKRAERFKLEQRCRAHMNPHCGATCIAHPTNSTEVLCTRPTTCVGEGKHVDDAPVSSCPSSHHKRKP